ncbi:dTDP-4-dehydrorhamnose 3,5-epimerase family protein [Tardiphaga sp.]|jgi:dTDP-4-dehydrorhamnose 3,5-epimerase|uniref:dTDP-4-dehydrorhamnose 3,5-epimerase family protein n=1 Tax=Tardiphaga sp. TaxID=1926292 RepID=UPI0037D9B558
MSRQQMIISETALAGAFTVDIDRLADNRGYFSRVLCVEEFAARGIHLRTVQANVSYNRSRGTMRGLHFQYPPAAEEKYVRCIRGAVTDVIVDLRPESPTWLKHVAIELSAENGRGLYIPTRFAHGFVTLTDDTELLYFMGNAHTRGAEGGLRFDDPALAIGWPPVRVLSERDTMWPHLSDVAGDIRARMTLPENTPA